MAQAIRKSVTLALLEAYFSSVRSLRSYLIDILDPCPGALAECTDQERGTFCDFLDTSYVAVVLQSGHSLGFKNVTAMTKMRDIISRAHETIFKSTQGRPNNVITHGYQLASKNADQGKNASHTAIVNRYVNTIVTALQDPQWEKLLQLIGADAMLHLLTKTSIFISLPNECLCQMTGEPLIYSHPSNLDGYVPLGGNEKIQKGAMKRARPLQAEPVLSSKRPCLTKSFFSISSTAASNAEAGRQLVAQSIQRRTAADVIFVRSRLFYGRCSKDPDSQEIVLGLPVQHVMNRIAPAYYKKLRIPPEKYVDPDPRIQAEQARHLAKYVFPIQFGMSNVFSIPSKARFEASNLYNSLNRDSEIKAMGNQKTPKRLKSIMKVIENLIWRHGKCAYRPLCDKVCPSKIKRTTNRHIDNSIILELMSEQSSQLQSQKSQKSNHDANISVDSAGRSISAHGLSQADNNTNHKPRFAEFMCSHDEVFRYAILITKTVVPKALWGCKNNFKVIQRYVRQFITERRFETLSLHRILQNFSTSECDWLIPPGSAAQKQARVSITDSLKRRELLEEFIFWYFDSFLLPLLKTTFYVTESSAFRNEVLYFRQDDWEILCAPLIERLASATFQEIGYAEAQETLRQRRLGFSFVRLLPKDTGVRPIVNLRRRTTNARNGTGHFPGQSINQILQTTFQILTFEKQRQPHLLGASVFGPNEIYVKIKAFKKKLSNSHSASQWPRLYFVKVDVQACFDTIDQTTLIRILRKLISEDNYMIQRYGQISSAAGKIKKTYVKTAMPEDEHPHFLTCAKELAKVLWHTIFVDQVVYKFESTHSVLQLLEEHITENIVKMGQKYYRQMIGIPQGSVISTLLCSFFYGDMEKEFKFLRHDENMLLRLVDDYLFATTSISEARDFLDLMNRGHPDYGCFISKDKTLINFDHGPQIMNRTGPNQEYFPWCGLLINMNDLSVLADYSKFYHTPVQYSLTVEMKRRPGAAFVHKMLQTVKARTHILFCDTDLSSDHTVYTNIYQNFLMSAMKMHHYLLSWDITLSNNSEFLHNTVRQIIKYAWVTIRNKTTNRVSRANGGKCSAHRSVVFWLGTHAFHDVLHRKSERYASSSLLKTLAFELCLPRYRQMKRQYGKVIKEGSAGLAQVKF